MHAEACTTTGNTMLDMWASGEKAFYAELSTRTEWEIQGKAGLVPFKTLFKLPPSSSKQ